MIKKRLSKHFTAYEYDDGIVWYETKDTKLGVWSDVKSSDLRAIADDIDRRSEIKPKRIKRAPTKKRRSGGL